MCNICWKEKEKAPLVCSLEETQSAKRVERIRKSYRFSSKCHFTERIFPEIDIPTRKFLDCGGILNPITFQQFRAWEV